MNGENGIGSGRFGSCAQTAAGIPLFCVFTMDCSWETGRVLNAGGVAPWRFDDGCWRPPCSYWRNGRGRAAMWARVYSLLTTKSPNGERERERRMGQVDQSAVQRDWRRQIRHQVSTCFLNRVATKNNIFLHVSDHSASRESGMMYVSSSSSSSSSPPRRLFPSCRGESFGYDADKLACT